MSDPHVAHETTENEAINSPFVIHAVETAGAAVSPDGTNGHVTGAHVYVRDGIFSTESGVTLKLRKVPRMVVVEAGMKIKLPRPPQVWDPDQERNEENPLDPDFEEELNQARFHKGIASTNVYLSLGTEIVDVPAGMEYPGDPNWAEALEDLGITIPPVDKKRSRYVAWLRYYALNDDDFTALTKATALYSGHITEEQVQAVEDSFRSPGTGSTDTPDGAAVQS